MKRINLLSLTQAHDSLNTHDFQTFENHYGIEINHAELQELKALTELLCNVASNAYLFSDFYVGYKIPQIGKEFDLLRINSNTVINIELKRTSSEDKIRKQLIRNHYYLSFTGKSTYNITYVSDTRKIYYLNDKNSLLELAPTQLYELLFSQPLDFKDDIDTLFNPSDYLVSPFNCTSKFIRQEYFLTHQQEDFKERIINYLLSESASKFISVVGAAGMGKTLLVYDIVKSLATENKKALIVHCGYLNDGQHELNRHGWEIIEIKNLKHRNLDNYDVIVIDEVQRIYLKQLDDIIDFVTGNAKSCIFLMIKCKSLPPGKKEPISTEELTQ